MAKNSMTSTKNTLDLFRDTKIRYLGYANEIGGILRPVISCTYVRMCYGIALGYVCADTIDKAVSKLWCDGRPLKVLWATGDALIWQSLASLILPSMALNKILYHSNMAMYKYFPKLNPMQRMYATMGIGLISIPIIITPIDRGVDVFMNLTYRMLFS